MSDNTTNVVEIDALWSEILDFSPQEIDEEILSLGISEEMVESSCALLRNYAVMHGDLHNDNDRIGDLASRISQHFPVKHSSCLPADLFIDSDNVRFVTVKSFSELETMRSSDRCKGLRIAFPKRPHAFRENLRHEQLVRGMPFLLALISKNMMS